MTALVFVASLAYGEGTCGFLVDGRPTARLSCAAGGAWTVACPAPPAQGKVRATLSMAARDLEGEARLSLGTSGPVVLPLSGPGGRPSAFLVSRASAGLLPGQAIGPLQLCPTVQPGVAAGLPPNELPIEVVVSVHRIEGYDQVPLDGGVLVSTPRYDAGTVVARGRAVVVQREIPLVPILVGRDAIPSDDAVRGTLSIRVETEWQSVGYSGFVRPVALAASTLSVLVVDFVGSEVEAALGTDAVAAVQDDLVRWLAGELTPFASTVWSRSELAVPAATGPWTAPPAPSGWRTTKGHGVEVRVARFGSRIRAVVAVGTGALDAEARRAIDAAAAL